MKIKQLGIIRLEKLFYSDNCLTSNSSYINWIKVVAEEIESLGILAPIQLLGTAISPELQYCLRAEDTLFKLPDVKGYIRVFLLSPFIVLQIIRMRFKYRVVLCRIPEHGNLIVLPLLQLMGYRVFIWLVGNRK